jgi:hypothetical protein
MESADRQGLAQIQRVELVPIKIAGQLFRDMLRTIASIAVLAIRDCG